MPSSSMRLMMSVTASTKRRAATNGTTGKQSTAVTNIASLKITPVDPLTPEITQRQVIGLTERMRVCYTQVTSNIRTGDELVVGSKTYEIKGCGEWSDGSETLYELIVEENIHG